MKPKQLTNIKNWNHNRLLLNYQKVQRELSILIIILTYQFLYLALLQSNMNCPCCGGKMKANHGEKVTIFKCNSCGLSNTELNQDVK